MTTTRTLHLAADDPKQLRDACGSRLACLRGTLWITLDGERRDIVLRSGERFVVEVDRDFGRHAGLGM